MLEKITPSYIVAIGASAGGIEELITFFEVTPLDSVAYVIVQHLSAKHKSQMVTVLSRYSKLMVEEAEENMVVGKNRVYLIPGDKYMTIENGRLHLVDKSNHMMPHLTINTFFKSLAFNHGDKAIGVILSGMGTDGTDGVVAIHKKGGFVIVRNPDTSTFNSMPGSAIHAGVVDLILEPELMPAAIDVYVHQGKKVLVENQHEHKYLNQIIALVQKDALLDFSEYKKSTILRRTKKRAGYLNINQLSDYFDFLKINPAEVEALSKEFLISVTAFFRDKGAFDFINKDIIPQIFKGLLPKEELKMWIAGCATGEEVYSMAIMICEYIEAHALNTSVKLFATDIDTNALSVAGKGVYKEPALINVSENRLEKYFSREDDGFKVKSHIRKMVIFSKHDLVKNPPYCNMHFISCRNLLIYMTPVLQSKIFNALLFGLKKDGYLFLGSSEYPTPIENKLEVIHPKWKIYKNTTSKREVNFDTFSLPGLYQAKPGPPARNYNSKSIDLESDAIDMLLAREMDYFALCIDNNYQILKYYGDTSRYLLPKHFSSDVTELLPAPLAVAFNFLYSAVSQNGERKSISGIHLILDGLQTDVRLTLSPLLKDGSQEKKYLLVFTKDRDLKQADSKDVTFNEKLYFDQYTLNLEEELKELKGRYTILQEQLEASSENIQSFNEELLSSNEEMQSTNEEMQSINEELQTLNTDYQLKNKELSDLNDDLNNYFRSNLNGQLFIDENLLLIRFSPGTTEQINLLEADIGRPLNHISTNIKFHTMIDDVQQVLKSGGVISKQVETKNGKWFQMMIMPYLQGISRKQNGAILTFNDITELKMLQSELNHKNKSLKWINEDLENFVHAASHDLLAPLGNIENSIQLVNQMDAHDPKLEHVLHFINSSVQKFRSLITDISTIAKIENEMKSMEGIELEDLLDNVEWSLEHKITDAGAVINRDLMVKEIFFSKKNLRSIFYNLISNAIKFRAKANPIVHVKTELEGDHVILTVADNGKGMAKNELKTIFNMYGRLNQDIEGQGIGLYLAKKIIHSADGSIAVESEPGTGTKFVIRLKALKK